MHIVMYVVYQSKATPLTFPFSFQLKWIEAAHFTVLFLSLVWRTTDTLFALSSAARPNYTW